MERRVLWGPQMDGILGEEVPRRNIYGLRHYPIFRLAYLVNAHEGQELEVKYIKV